MMFQWTETQFTARIPQPDGSVDTVEVTATDFNEPGELRFIGMGLNHERYAWDRILEGFGGPRAVLRGLQASDQTGHHLDEHAGECF